MSNKRLETEQDVLDRIGAEDFRSIKKEQLIQFVSSLPEMDKEVAMACIAQFPEFRKSANDIIEQLSKTCDSLIADNKDSRDKAIQSYQLILVELQTYLESHKLLSHRKKKEIIDKMVEVADKINEINDKNIQHQNDFLKTIGGIAVAALAIAGAILGVNITNRND